MNKAIDALNFKTNKIIKASDQSHFCLPHTETKQLSFAPQYASTAPFHSPMTTYLAHPDTEQHSRCPSFFDAANEYVPPLPPPIMTSFSSSYDDYINDTVEITSSEDSGSILRSPLKQNNQKRLKRTSIEKKNEKIYPITEVFNPLFLDERKKESSSRPNFATVLVRNFFKREVRMTSNVAGKCGKNQLNTEMMAAIKVATFRMWPLQASEDEKTAWRLCRKAIDEAGRRLYRSRSPSVKENIRCSSDT